MRRHLWITAAVLAQLSGIVARSGDEDAETTRQPQFTISKETTFVTEPLTQAGDIDYFTALNERLGRGVTPENNANVLFFQALGPKPGGIEQLPEFFELMGMEVPPAEGDYFVDLEAYLASRRGDGVDEKRQTTVMEQFKQARRRPWRRDDFPEIVDWLEANEKPLELVVRGTQREMYFSPYPTMPLLIAVPLPGILESWSLAETLATRAMLHAGEGRFDAARQDLLACHRLGRLIGHGVTHIEFLTAAFIDEMAAQADVAFIEISRPSAKQAIAYLDAINSLPTLPDAAKSMNWGERLGYLQLVSVFMQSPEEMLSEVHELSVFQVAVAKAMLSYVDWDVVLRHGNRSYDVMVGAMQLDTRGQRMAAFADCDRELEQRHSKRPEEILQALFDADTRSQRVGEILLDFQSPAYYLLQNSEDAATQAIANLRIALALAAYHSDHGTYPQTLQALSPKYLNNVPPDLFSEKPLIYGPTEQGYLLYSVGPNEADDQGRTHEDDPPGDDRTVRMPMR